jgi:uncharacterized membrane protein
MKRFLAHGRADLIAGLAVVLPAAVSIAVVVWLFGTVSTLTDTLLLLVPSEWVRSGEGPLHLYSRVVALLVAILLIWLVGRASRYYFGKKLIQGVDEILIRVPLLNRIYTGLKQIHEAFNTSKVSSFKKVVLVEFPRPGLHSIGFITGTQNAEAQARMQKRLLCVFVPTPPLTSGSVILVPEADAIPLEMSVADGLKFIMSLGSVSPPYPAQDPVLPAAAADSQTQGCTTTAAPLAPGFTGAEPASEPARFGPIQLGRSPSSAGRPCP